jgi:hypothetical protein
MRLPAITLDQHGFVIDAIGEQVEKVSLGAGNSGREFDRETNYRVAEFKFVHCAAAQRLEH